MCRKTPGCLQRCCNGVLTDFCTERATSSSQCQHAYCVAAGFSPIPHFVPVASNLLSKISLELWFKVDIACTLQSVFLIFFCFAALTSAGLWAHGWRPLSGVLWRRSMLSLKMCGPWRAGVCSESSLSNFPILLTHVTGVFPTCHPTLSQSNGSLCLEIVSWTSWLCNTRRSCLWYGNKKHPVSPSCPMFSLETPSHFSCETSHCCLCSSS